MRHLSLLKGLNQTELYYEEEKLKEQLEICKSCLSDSADFRLDQDAVLLDSFHSATIEGARTTVENVRKSLEDPKSKSDRMVVNNMKALNRVYSGWHLTEENLRNLWEGIVDGVCENERLKGELYRNGEVYIFSYDRIVHTPAQAAEIEEYMDSLFGFLEFDKEEPVIKAILLHFYFVYIHPYCDGNGRTARILQNYYLFTAGYSGVKRIRISQAINLHLGAYYKALEQAERPIIKGQNVTLDLTVFLEYMLDRIIEACKMAERKQYLLSECEKLLLKRMSKRGIGAEITVANAAVLMDMSERGARNVLNRLCEKQYLIKGRVEGKRKNLYRLIQLISD